MFRLVPILLMLSCNDPILSQQRLLSEFEIGLTYKEFMSVSKTVIIGWIIELVGMVFWLYGYFVTGNPTSN